MTSLGKHWKISEKHKLAISKHMKNKKMSDITKLKLSLAKKGKPAHNKGKKLSEETKMKISYSKTGKCLGSKNPNWVKDRTKLKKSERKDKDVQYIYWRKEVKNRDNWKCKLLNNDCKGRLEAHHIYNWIDYPELRYVINNGITLCAFHHPRGREKEKQMIPIFQELLVILKE